MTRDERFLVLLDKGQVSVNAEEGLVFSRDKKRNKNPLLAGYVERGYIVLHLSLEGRRFHIFAHRAVWVSVHGPVPEGLSLDHINRTKADNRISNLRLVTPRENAANAPVRRGEDSSVARLREHEVLEIRKLIEEGETYHTIAKRHNVSTSLIWAIKFKHCWGWL